MNDLSLMRKNMWRKPVRTWLLLISIFIAFLIFSVMVIFEVAINDIKVAPNRMVTLSKINFTESLPIAYYDRIAQTPGVIAATHMNWFGGYYQDPRRGFIAMFAVDPESYLRVYHDDVPLTAQQRQAWLADRTGILVGESIAKRFHWRIGQHVPIMSNIFSNKTNSGHS